MLTVDFPPGTRSVSSLTPAQLERKRANDREAQRAIRARTKHHIDRLEKELADCKAQKMPISQTQQSQMASEVQRLRCKVHQLELQLREERATKVASRLHPSLGTNGGSHGLGSNPMEMTGREYILSAHGADFADQAVMSSPRSSPFQQNGAPATAVDYNAAAAQDFPPFLGEPQQSGAAGMHDNDAWNAGLVSSSASSPSSSGQRDDASLPTNGFLPANMQSGMMGDMAPRGKNVKTEFEDIKHSHRTISPAPPSRVLRGAHNQWPSC